MRKVYSKEELLNAIENIHNNSWKSFANGKEGKWCKRNNMQLFNHFRKKFAKSNRVNYKKLELLYALNHKYKGHWRNWQVNKEGCWCKSNKLEWYLEFQRKYKGRTANFRESEYQKEFVSNIKEYLIKHNIDYTLREEVYIGEYKGINNRIDIILELNDYNLTLPIELKHDDSRWTESELKDQKERYDHCLKDYEETYIVSPKGKYGFSEKEFLFILESLITKQELYLGNSLSWIRENEKNIINF